MNGQSQREVYADGKRMLLVTRHGSSVETLLLPAVMGTSLSVSSELGGIESADVTFKSWGPVEFAHHYNAATVPVDLLAEFLPATSLTIEQLLAIVHRKMQERDAAAAAVLPGCTE